MPDVITISGSTLLLAGAMVALIRDTLSKTLLTERYLLSRGFIYEEPSGKGYKSYTRWVEKGWVTIQLRGGKFYFDVTNFEIRTTGQLKKLFEGLTGEGL